MAERRKTLLWILLVSIAAFSLFKYISAQKETLELSNSLNQIKAQVTSLQQEKVNLEQAIQKAKDNEKSLTQEKIALQDNLKASEEKLSKMDLDFAQAQKTIQDLNTQMEALKTENASLAESKNKLSTDVAVVAQENEGLKARMNSIAELKKAIKELKRSMHKVSVQVKEQVKVEENKVVDSAEGNRGFVIKDGRPTISAKPKIEVIPLPSNP